MGISLENLFEDIGALGNVIRDDSQQLFLAQHSVPTLLRYCFEKLQGCSNIAALCCSQKIVAANRPVYGMTTFKGLGSAVILQPRSYLWLIYTSQCVSVSETY